MFKMCITATTILFFIACGSEQGVKARLHEKTNVTPESVAVAASRKLDTNGKMAKYGPSISSEAIKQDTLGFLVETTPAPNNKVVVNVRHYQSYEQNKCRNTMQEQTFNAGELSAWKQLKTADLSCYDVACNYMILVVYQSMSSFVNGNGAIVPAYVPVLLRTNDPVGGKRQYKPEKAKTPFTFVSDTNTTCPISDQVILENQQYALPPGDDFTPNYNHFSDPDNNTWI